MHRRCNLDCVVHNWIRSLFNSRSAQYWKAAITLFRKKSNTRLLGNSREFACIICVRTRGTRRNGSRENALLKLPLGLNPIWWESGQCVSIVHTKRTFIRDDRRLSITDKKQVMCNCQWNLFFFFLSFL